MHRRIYDNIRKAIGYVFTIHIPIAFASLLAPVLGISPASLLLLPLHAVLLELVIDPTRYVVLERQPAEPDIMERVPRNPREKLLTARALIKSVLQGIAIFVASFGMYLAFLSRYPDNAPDIGKSIFAMNYYFCICYIAWYKAFLESGIDTGTANTLIWKINEAFIKQFPSTLIKLFARHFYLGSFRKMAALSGIRNNCSRNIVTMVNNPFGYDRWEQLTGKGRIIPAFPGAGGKIENGALYYALTPKMAQVTRIGELSGEKSPRILELYEILKSAGFPVSICSNMDIW